MRVVGVADEAVLAWYPVEELHGGIVWGADWEEEEVVR